MTEKENIKDFDCCPHCGDTFGYYQKVYASGWLHDMKLFENHDYYNSGMHDSLQYSRATKYYYCYECNKKICKVKEDD